METIPTSDAGGLPHAWERPCDVCVDADVRRELGWSPTPDPKVNQQLPGVSRKPWAVLLPPRLWCRTVIPEASTLKTSSVGSPQTTGSDGGQQQSHRVLELREGVSPTGPGPGWSHSQLNLQSPAQPPTP